MTEINRDLSLNNISFKAKPKSTKNIPEKQGPHGVNSDPDGTDLDRTPGALYNRVQLNPPKKEDITLGEAELRERLGETLDALKNHPNAFQLAEQVFDTTYQQALLDSQNKQEAYETALKEADNFLQGLAKS